MKAFAAFCLVLTTFAQAQNDGLQFRSAPSFEGRNPTKSKPLSHPFPNNENFYYYYQGSQQQSNAAPSNSPQNSFYTPNNDYAAAFYQSQFDRGNPLLQKPLIPPQSYIDQFYSLIPYGDSPFPKEQQGLISFGINPFLEKQSVGDDEVSSGNKNKESSENNTNENSSASAQSADQIPTISPVSFVLPLPTRSATGATFTNAHHYPYPQGLMRYYYQQLGHPPQSNQPAPISNNQPLQYYYYLPGGSSNPNFPLMDPGSFMYSFLRGSLPDSTFREHEGNIEEADEKEKNDNSQQQQTGKANSNSEEPSSNTSRKQIYTYNLPGFTQLGPLYSYHPIPQSKHANSRV